MDDVMLFHGSRGGIQGTIQPQSRVRCDFGRGFYMGTNPIQAKSLVASDANPYFYELNLKLSRIPESRILQLNGLDWAYFVLYNRCRLESINNTKFYQKYQTMEKQYDVIIGPIADDNMSRVIKDFVNCRITDKALLESISAIDYGIQYVAKSPLACMCIEKVSEIMLPDEVTIPLLIQNAQRRQEGLDVAEKMIRKYNRQGNLLNEILEHHQKDIIDSQSLSR